MTNAEVRAKKLLIDARWGSTSALDRRLYYYSDLRIDWVRGEELNEAPLEQFLDGFYCNSCGVGFITDEIVNNLHPKKQPKIKLENE